MREWRRNSAFVDYPLEELQKISDVHLVGPFLVSQAAAREMIRQGHGGRVINISSVHEDLPMPTNAACCVSNRGIGPRQNRCEQPRTWSLCLRDRCDVEAKHEMEKAPMSEIPLGRCDSPVVTELS